MNNDVSDALAAFSNAYLISLMVLVKSLEQSGTLKANEFEDRLRNYTHHLSEMFPGQHVEILKSFLSRLECSENHHA
ncbi:hypothetical protein [Phyllobacterium sophorae]|uniref:Uncharacterized protein n=1 Tax=Phyllobacterium sophorae TaxID=1520277 RepID=A0A2P7B359_9HYPH|nr:hypothetical protein [Phyllobacterium sophorae]PSH60924.1 hypothetical protein CU103_25535 [Phyllobacterium sophorae]